MIGSRIIARRAITRQRQQLFRTSSSSALHRIHRIHTPRSSASSSSSPEIQQSDLDYAVDVVRKGDPAGYLPGRLLADAAMTRAYYATHAFWVETGLRVNNTAAVANKQHATAQQQLDWWRSSIDTVFDDDSAAFAHPTLRLLAAIRHQSPEWKKQHFHCIINGRQTDLSTAQYETLDELMTHAEQSSASLLHLVLESGGLTADTNPAAHEAARLAGIGMGLGDALRTSIPVMSTTGRLIIPTELTVRYGVRSPRYLLSALGQGDDSCVAALQSAVGDISEVARSHIREARALQNEVLAESSGEKAAGVFLPMAATEAFLDRLALADYRLTDRDLRNVGVGQHLSCAVRMIGAYYRSTY